MPINLSVDELKPGMRLFQAIHQDQHALLTAGKVLEEWEINSLRRRFPNLMIRISDPLLDEFVEFGDDSHDQNMAVTVNRQMGRLMTNVRDKLSEQTALESADISGLRSTILEVMQYINDNPVTAALLIHSGDWSSYLQEHSGNVFYLSLLVGNAIREYVHRERERTTSASHLATRYGMNLTPLALGCLFHDIGMIPLDYLFKQEGPLSPEEVTQIRQHPTVGGEMLPKDFDAVAKMVIRTHHENFDGTGYPNQISQEKLHVFGRVIRVADAYDAATSPRVYRQAKSSVRTLWEMSSGPYKKYYDPIIVKILMGLVQPYPIGAKVQLNCGRYGVVVNHNRKAPFRPSVIVAFDETGKKLTKKDLEPPVNLARHLETQITNFAGEDLSFLYEGPSGENEGPSDEVWGNTETDEIDEIDEIDSEELGKTLFDFAYP